MGVEVPAPLPSRRATSPDGAVQVVGRAGQLTAGSTAARWTDLACREECASRLGRSGMPRPGPDSTGDGTRRSGKVLRRFAFVFVFAFVAGLAVVAPTSAASKGVYTQNLYVYRVV